MADNVVKNIMTVVTVISLLLGLIASTGGWARRAGQIETEMKSCIKDVCRIESMAVEAHKTAANNKEGVAVITVKIDQLGAEIMRRLDRIEAAQQ